MFTRVALAALLGLSFPGVVCADPFQFVVQNTGAYAAYAAVYIGTDLVGYTDQYGRIEIKKPPGQYNCTVNFLRPPPFSVALRITGNTKLTRLNLSR